MNPRRRRWGVDDFRPLCLYLTADAVERRYVRRQLRAAGLPFQMAAGGWMDVRGWAAAVMRQCFTSCVDALRETFTRDSLDWKKLKAFCREQDLLARVQLGEAPWVVMAEWEQRTGWTSRG